MKRWLWLLAVAGCATELSTSEVEQHAGDYQAGDYQSGDYQAGDYQAGDYQAGDYQGAHYDSTDLAGGTLGSLALSDVSVTGTRLVAWRMTKVGWEQRFPDHICYWNADRTSGSCGATIDLSTTPSPLTGMRFRTTLRTESGTMTGWVQIGASSSALNAVSKDPSRAMWSLKPFGTGSPLYGYSATGSCTTPGGCRANNDLWVYDLKLINADGTQIPFCSSNMSYALKGTWDAFGRYSNNKSKFTFACSTGTIAKCTRWGYRNWVTNATRSDGVTNVSLAPYHQSCVRAAMADYCSNGHTFTKSHTFIDIFDYQNSGTVGFIKGATNWPWESRFDASGAFQVDVLRYMELAGTEAYGSINDPDPSVGCPSRYTYYSGSDDVPPTWLRNSPPQPPTGTPYVEVRSGPGCAHTPLTRGKWLNPACGACEAAVGGSSDAYGSLSYCTDPTSPYGWNDRCVAKAEALGICGAHSECQTGDGIYKWESQCTAQVCSDPSYASCCYTTPGAGNWTSSCTARANNLCTGGMEHGGVIVTQMFGFCSQPASQNTF